MNNFPTRETPRLLLRELTPQDAPRLLEMYGDAQAMQWLGSDPLTELAQAQALIETFATWRQQATPGTRWGIECRQDGKLLGDCGLFKWSREYRSCFVAFALAPDARGRGVMGETLRTVLAWGFAQMQLNRVQALVHPQNQASLQLLERLGFEQEGRLREAGYWAGRHHDLLQLSLLRREFRP